tara:strand:+ start:1537 stop:2127 length:591 start_codon:yes stop_codon:yes gene_type:complete
MGHLHSSDPLRSDSDDDLSDLVGQIEDCLDDDKPEVMLDFPEDSPCAVHGENMVGVGWYHRSKLYLKEGMAARLPIEIRITPPNFTRRMMPLAIWTENLPSRKVLYKGEAYMEFDVGKVDFGFGGDRAFPADNTTEGIESLITVPGRGDVLQYKGADPPKIGTVVSFRGQQYHVLGVESGGPVKNAHGLIVQEAIP